jgi:hypothetical protein
MFDQGIRSLVLGSRRQRQQRCEQYGECREKAYEGLTKHDLTALIQASKSVVQQPLPAAQVTSGEFDGTTGLPSLDQTLMPEVTL